MSGTREVLFVFVFRNDHSIINFSLGAQHWLWTCEKRFNKPSTRKCSRASNKAWVVFPEILELVSWSQGHLNWILKDCLPIPIKLARRIEASQEEGNHVSIDPKEGTAWRIRVLCSWAVAHGGRGRGSLIIFGLWQDPRRSELHCPLSAVFLLPAAVWVGPLDFPKKVRNPDFFFLCESSWCLMVKSI